MEKRATKNVQLVLQHCCKTSWIAMLRVSPPTFKPVINLICCKTCFMWVVKRATSLFNSFSAMLQNKLQFFVARFFVPLHALTFSVAVSRTTPSYDPNAREGAAHCTYLSGNLGWADGTLIYLRTEASREVISSTRESKRKGAKQERMNNAWATPKLVALIPSFSFFFLFFSLNASYSLSS